MAKFCIRLGRFNKILSIPFLLTLIQIVISIYYLYITNKISVSFIASVGQSLGQIVIKIIPYIKCFSISSQKEKTNGNVNAQKKYFALFYLALYLFNRFKCKLFFINT